MLSAGLSGFLLGAGLIVAIGAQNAFVLRQGLKREHVLAVALACALSDALLIAAGVGGLGAAVASAPNFLRAVALGGALFLFAYGALAFRRAWRPAALRPDGQDASSLKAALAACLAFTFLNPHVYLDTVVLVGSLSAVHEGGARLAFGFGAASASVAWFFSLGYGARRLAPLFERPTAWRVLDVGIGVVMWGLAASLAARNA
jgi:L-lysine exporter family protein LysE/ArgO